ncbi:MAG: glutathione S-transferase family protein [Pseudomonadota bacterium]
MLTVIGPKGGRVFRVVWALHELGLPFHHEVAGPHSEGMYAVNPLGQAPAVRDGETILTDSWAILNYLADRAGRLTYPAGSAERALMESRINFVVTELEAPIWLMARHGFVLPKEARAPGMRAVAEADFARAEAKFETLLGDATYFGGDAFSLADIFATDMVRWAQQARVPLTSKVYQEYYDRISARPAWAHSEAALA